MTVCNKNYHAFLIQTIVCLWQDFCNYACTNAGAYPMCESRAHSSIPVAKSTLKYLVTTSILFLVHVGDASCSQNIEVTYSSSFFFY